MTARCLETRRTPEGFRRRRYEQDGVRFTTIEVPLKVWREVARADRVRAAVERHRRVQAAATLRTQALQLLSEGWKPSAVASHLNVADSTVRSWRARS